MKKKSKYTDIPFTGLRIFSPSSNDIKLKSWTLEDILKYYGAKLIPWQNSPKKKNVPSIF